jgi:hypothetical protein
MLKDDILSEVGSAEALFNYLMSSQESSWQLLGIEHLFNQERKSDPIAFSKLMLNQKVFNSPIQSECTLSQGERRLSHQAIGHSLALTGEIDVTFSFQEKSLIGFFRIDPLEGRSCRIWMDTLSYQAEDGGEFREVDSVQSNGFKQLDGSIEFITSDPQITFRVAKKMKALRFKAQIRFLDIASIENKYHLNPTLKAGVASKFFHYFWRLLPFWER